MVSLHCPLCCDQPFEDQQSLFFHLRGLRNNLFCPICSERFSSLEILVTHLSRKCHGPQLPTEAKRRCLTNISSSDKSDLKDEVIKNDNQPSETPVNLQSTSKIPFEIPRRLLKNVSIRIKEPVEKSPQKQAIGINYSKPIVLAVDPKNPSITNGFPLQSVVLSPNVATTVKNTDDKEPGSTSLNITSNVENISTSSDSILKQALIDVPSRCLYSTTEHNNERQINKNPDGEGEGGGETTSPITVNIDSSTQLVTPVVTTNSVGLNNPTGQSIIEQAPQYLQNVSKKKRGRPRKKNNLPISNVAVTTNIAKEIMPPESNARSNVVEGTLKNSSSSDAINGDKTIKNSSMPSLNGLDDDNGHFEESMDQNESQPVEEQTVSNVETSVKNIAETRKANKGTTELDKEKYLCSVCDVTFSSIYEHIKLFHNGKEVVVEAQEEDIQEDFNAYQSEDKGPVQQNDPSINSDTTCLEAKSDEPAVQMKPTVVSTEEEVQIVKDVDNHQETSINSKKSNTILQTQIIWPRALNKNYVKQVNKLNKSGEWLRTKGSKRSIFHYVTDTNKMVRLLSELKDNDKLHPDFKVQIKELYENPKINVISITNELNTPFFTYNRVDLVKPIPMFVIVRQPSEPDTLLGGIASYVLANPCSDSAHVAEDTKVIAVMKVILGSDQTLTVENIAFKNKPAIESMIPVLEDVSEPDIPLLNGGKILKWRCKKCMTSTWKFPLSKDSHICNGCTICHRPFATSIALKKHMFVHKKNVTNYCEMCHLAFVSSKVMETHQAEHENHILCPMCNLFVPLHLQEAHKQLHLRMPVNQFPCSVCHKMFASGEEVKAHETKTCGRLVAKYNCSSCDKKFFSLTALSFHSSDHKNIDIQFPCRFCQKTFIKEKEQCPRKAEKRKPSSYLQKIWHERIHTRDRPFFCSACPKRFRSLDHQTVHSNKAHCSFKHKDVPIYMCSICNKLFQNAQKLETHKKELHMLYQPT